MKSYSTRSDLKAALSAERASGKSIGLVPTMGALHAGHISLVERSVAENDVTVTSIFVNPTQFNDKSDLLHYPRTPEKDAELLQPAGCTYIFAPSEAEMYPEPDTRVFDLGTVAQVMEGAHRPGHFNGVAQIVSKLFEIVTPDRAYFGEKDFQQIAVIREMVRQLKFPVDIVACPIIREPDGLAMSSRNSRLTPEQRKTAATVSKALFESSTMMPSKTVEQVIHWVTETINKEKQLHVEYFEIVDGNTLQPISSWNDSDFVVGCIAVFCGDVRLIDNVRYKSPSLFIPKAGEQFA